MIIKDYENIKQRFYAKTKLADNGCLEWTGCTRRKRKDEGRFRLYGKTESAYRVAWRLHFGPIFGAAEVLHSCDNRLCVRLGHLWLGTQLDNMRDMCLKNRQQRGSRNGRAILNDEQVLKIKEDLAAGMPQGVVAKKNNVSPPLISLIASGARWKHVLLDMKLQKEKET